MVCRVDWRFVSTSHKPNGLLGGLALVVDPTPDGAVGRVE